MTLPTLRWGIIGTGLISSWFVSDLVETREDAQATHLIQAIGSSSDTKAQAFIKEHSPNSNPSLYSSYDGVYADPNVDIVYIGLPHVFHKEACLQAISHGKHVLCEKPFTVNAREAKEVFEAARQKGVFVMEALWTRFMPLVRQLTQIIHVDKAIGNVHRVFCDFGLDIDLDNLPDSSRLKDPALGAGSLLDIGIYSLTWGLLLLEDHPPDDAAQPQVFSAQTLHAGADIATSIILSYPDSGRQGILTSTMQTKTNPVFARVEGSRGSITIEGVAASLPGKFTVFSKDAKMEPVVYEAPKSPGKGFFYEADAVALDIAAKRVENEIMPWKETVRVLEIMDGIRERGGGHFPQDD
ncbi:NAD(P)-binding protein [Aspergillus steynii IBT 23096]|uniref:D-xylose 1-dehydrogenase (NADP(+), D-xylono-1,5-lactone-forming) n=1 Tax=Aspergillus steynii IBT 23096 TaxID=1392250 RepID=A0A2I2G131_9EURO|nr:NAD(P)-binding protein [Aspergillus steynii IBT 23096]PLB46590.1 NAD(P)-binding protein [Aspergillus steynii IBT 23096]